MGRIAATGLAAALGLGLAVPAAADELDDRKQELSTEVSEASQSAQDSAAALQKAIEDLESSQSELSEAEEALASTQEELSTAKSDYSRLKDDLAQAEADLEEATAAVEAGRKAVQSQQDMVGDIARTDYQQQHNMIGIAVLVEPGSSAGVQSRMQVAETMMETNRAALERLDEMQRQLEDYEAAKAEAEEKVAADTAAAESAVASLTELEAAEREQQESLAASVAANDKARKAAQEQAKADDAHHEELKKEQGKVNEAIAEREAEAERKAAAKAKADREAREAAAAKKAAEQKAKDTKESAAKVSAKKPTPAPKTSSAKSSNSTKVSSSGLITPVQGRITSRYGMRVHPVTGVYKLHDGLDYGAACGTPIRAAADGKVTQRYYNAGYGNRIFVDHGKVNGKRLVTSYNHLSRYNARVGQNVKQGDVIGYVGTTGYSTGCHLHLMTWQNGQLVDPAKLL